MADCDTMWQIDIDVLSEYWRKGIASALTSQYEYVKDDQFVPYINSDCLKWLYSVDGAML